MLVALAMTDLLEGMVAEPLFVWYLVGLLKRRPIPCHFTVYAIPAIALSILTLNTLMVASFNVFLAVEYFQFYLEHISTKTVVIVTPIIWRVTLFATVGGTAFENGLDRFRKIPIATIAAVNIVITAYCTIKVQMTAYRQRRAIQNQVEAVQQETTEEEVIRRRQQSMCRMTMSLIVVATFLFYCPYIITTIIHLTQGKDVTDDFQYLSFTISVTFVHLQSLVNPIVISLRLSYIREEIKNNLLCRS